MDHLSPELAILRALVLRSTSRRGLLRGSAAAAALLAGAGRFVAGAHQSSGAPSGEVTWGIEQDPVNLIPFGAVATANMWGKEFMYDSLLQWDADLKIQPALAESFEAAPDGTSYTFKLRQGVTFHDGTPLTAADVKYSLELAPDAPEPAIKIPYIANLASVEVIDDHTAKVVMAKADPTLPGTLAWARYTPIVPNGVYDRINVLSEGIGTGPFKLVEFSSNDQVVYEANPNYWNPGVPCVAKLTLKVLPDEQARVAALRAGEIDGCTLSADVAMSLQNDDSVQVLKGLFAAPRVIHLNTTKDVPWRDVKVRQALSKAIDRQEIIDKVYGGQAELTGPIPPGFGDWPLANDALATAYAQDVAAAKQLMADAGHGDGFEVTLQAIAQPRDFTQIAEILREQLKAINVTVNVEPLEIGTFAKNVGAGEFDWASTGRGMRGDPSGFLVDYRNGMSTNVSWFGDGWKNEELDKLYDDALATTDTAKRHAAYARIQQILVDDAVNLWTVQPYKFQVVAKRLTGMFVSYTDFNPGLRTACITGE